jgi:hypothetical protein
VWDGPQALILNTQSTAPPFVRPSLDSLRRPGSPIYASAAVAGLLNFGLFPLCACPTARDTPSRNIFARCSSANRPRVIPCAVPRLDDRRYHMTRAISSFGSSILSGGGAALQLFAALQRSRSLAVCKAEPKPFSFPPRLNLALFSLHHLGITIVPDTPAAHTTTRIVSKPTL